MGFHQSDLTLDPYEEKAQTLLVPNMMEFESLTGDTYHIPSYSHLQEMQYADECTALRGQGRHLGTGGVKPAASGSGTARSLGRSSPGGKNDVPQEGVRGLGQPDEASGELGHQQREVPESE